MNDFIDDLLNEPNNYEFAVFAAALALSSFACRVVALVCRDLEP